ncbi:MAG TPA: pentapeptide repeat-containing protein [Propionibacteriaceae bacterium]|nr:pentapeptide repeat-containing protein [Propionibacteriaceae bacterium]
MADFFEADLTGSRFRRVDLTDARFEMVNLSRAEIRSSYLEGTTFRSVDMKNVVMRGVGLLDVDISGEIRNVTINGVEVASLINAELDRRDPERVKMRPTDPAGFREAWDVVERLWSGTVE